MARYMFLMECKEGYEEEYRKRHKEVYPELLTSLKREGVSNYSIFIDGTKLYAFMEVDDFHLAMKALSYDKANRKWQNYMSDILKMDKNGNPKMYLLDEEVFYLK